MTDSNQEQIFLKWLNEHRGILIKVTRSFAISRDDQQDLAQEILIQLWLSMDRFAGQSKLSTWIYRVALNVAMTWQRGERRRWYRIKNMMDTNAYWLRNSDPEDPRLTALYEAIHKLLPGERYLVLLYLDDLPYSDIADIIGISENNVGVRISRVRKKLSALCNGGSDQ